MFIVTGTNYAEQYMKELIGNVYPYTLKSAKLRSGIGDNRYKVVDNTTIKIPTLSVGGRMDADNDNIQDLKRRHNNNWETKTLTFHRYFKDLIAPADIKGTNEVEAITNITKVYNDEQKTPEMDAYTFSKIYKDFTSLGGTPDTTTITTNNVLGVFDEMYKQLLTARADVQNSILYCTPDAYTILKNAKDVTRFIVSGNKKIDRGIYSIDDIQEVVIVSPELLKTDYNFSDGWMPKATAGQINMMLICPSAVITPEFYATVNLDAPTAKSDGKYVYYEESWDDVFILSNKVGAVAINVTPYSAPASTCAVTLTVTNANSDNITGATVTVVSQGVSVSVTDNEDGTYSFTIEQGTTAKIYIDKTGYDLKSVDVTAVQSGSSTYSASAVLTATA